VPKDYQYDVFIAHASEDKDTIARPLAKLLQALGLKVWFDEFSLQVGDSLSRSIDKGLALSRFGVVILSKSFFKKEWPEYELRGLVSKEIGRDKAVLPIWHQVTREEVLSFSPPLADKLALNTSNDSLETIAIKLLKVVKPHLYKNLQRFLRWRKKIENAQHAVISRNELKVNEKPRHSELPPPLMVRANIVTHILGKVADFTFEDFVENLKKDMEPARELAVWERIASAFLDIVAEEQLNLAAQKKEIFHKLLWISFQPLDESLVQKLLADQDPLLKVALLAYLNTGSL